MSESPRERIAQLVAALVGAFDYGEVADQIEAEAALMAAVDALILAKEAAWKYAKHSPTCYSQAFHPSKPQAKTCDCGLDTVRGEHE
jgi:hypothetical protein